jgi:F-type H+-transporting ATPase subunit epsilon
MPFRFKLVTPDRSLFDEEVDSVTIPTADGEITVLPHHAELAALLVPGVMIVKRGNAISEVASSGGFLRIDAQGNAVALTDTAERGEELDLSTIEQAKKRAEEVMKKAVTVDDVAFAAAAAGLERELARYKVAMKHRHGGRDLPIVEQARIRKNENES